MIEYRFINYLELAQGGSPSVSIAYYVLVDSTKATRGVGNFTRFNAIDGGVFTQHYISLDVKGDYDIKKMIHKVKKN